jgi:hypothetical protein
MVSAVVMASSAMIIPPSYALPATEATSEVTTLESPSFLDAEERETISVFQRNTPSVVNITSLQAVQVSFSDGFVVPPYSFSPAENGMGIMMLSQQGNELNICTTSGWVP